MSRPLDKAKACGGTHLLYSLVVLLRADERESVLTGAVRDQLRAYLGRVAAAAIRSQGADGSWEPDWHTPAPRPSGTDRKTPAHLKVMITGHQVEWLWLLPPDLLPPRESFLRAARWLQVRLLADSKETLMEHYCPYSHAGRVLLVATETPVDLLGGTANGRPGPG